jgi:hypothetical protein
MSIISGTISGTALGAEGDKCDDSTSHSESKPRIHCDSRDKEESNSPCSSNRISEAVVTRKELWSYYREQLVPVVLLKRLSSTIKSLPEW